MNWFRPKSYFYDWNSFQNYFLLGKFSIKRQSLKLKHNFIKDKNVQPPRFLFFQKSWLYLIAIPDDSVNNDGTVDDEESTKNADQRLSSKNI